MSREKSAHRFFNQLKKKHPKKNRHFEQQTMKFLFLLALVACDVIPSVIWDQQLSTWRPPTRSELDEIAARRTRRYPIYREPETPWLDDWPEDVPIVDFERPEPKPPTDPTRVTRAPQKHIKNRNSANR